MSDRSRSRSATPSTPGCTYINEIDAAKWATEYPDALSRTQSAIQTLGDAIRTAGEYIAYEEDNNPSKISYKDLLRVLEHKRSRVRYTEWTFDWAESVLRWLMEEAEIWRARGQSPYDMINNPFRDLRPRLSPMACLVDVQKEVESKMALIREIKL